MINGVATQVPEILFISTSMRSQALYIYGILKSYNGGSMKKWECTVCGYIHTGEQPPEICPVCGADRSKFIEITDVKEASADGGINEKSSQAESSPMIEAPPSTLLGLANNLLIKHHLHPISVHIPNGMVPAIVVFIFLAVFFHAPTLAKAAFYNSMFVLLSLPVVLYTGFNEWQKKYKASMTRMFIAKISAAGVVTVTSVIIVVWYLINPEIAQPGSGFRSIFLLIHLVMLAATGIAGFIGGKLVFKD
jgi:uncharacterized membrane protein